MNRFIKKGILTLLTTLIIAVNAYSLEYIETFSSIADSFSSFVDKNAGTTVFPSLDIPSGGREESLGSAFTAVADDISFFEYNPAASCVLKETGLAFFHNSWIADSNIETLSGTIRNDNFGCGAKLKCFYVPFTEYNDFGDRVASSYYSETTAVVNASYNFFNGYYFKGLAVGANAKMAWRAIPDYTDRDTGEIIKHSGISQSALAFMTDVGVLLRFNAAKFFDDRDPNLKVGLTLQNIGVSLTGFKSAQGVHLDDSLPTAINAGISYRFIKPAMIAFDFKQPVNLLDFSKTQMCSFGVGLDVNVTDFVEVMAGFRLKGANPRISLGTEVKLNQFILDFNYTFDLTSSVNPVNHFSLALKMNFGDRGRYVKELEAEGYYEDGLKYYAQGRLDEAVESWEKCLKINPGFTPARNSIKLVSNSKKLFDRVIDIQSLE